MTTEREFKAEILKQELSALQNKIHHFDNLRWKVKQTSIVLWTATIGLGLKIDHELFWLSFFVVLPFWMIDSRYRRSYRLNRLRQSAIIKFIRAGKYLLLGKAQVTLSALLSTSTSDHGNKDEAEFPVPDPWALNTVKELKRKKEMKLFNSIIDETHLALYGSMTSISMILIIMHFCGTLQKVK